jgi:hypothetical protein
LVEAKNGRPSVLEDFQTALSLNWLTATVENNQIEPFKEYLVSIDDGGDFEMIGAVKAELKAHAGTSAFTKGVPISTPTPQQPPRAGGRKRAATLSSADRPAAKTKRSATPKKGRASIPMAIQMASVSMAAVSSLPGSKTPATPSTATNPLGHSTVKPQGFQPLTPAELQLKEERRKLYLAQIVQELDQWCKENSPGSRTAFLDDKTAANTKVGLISKLLVGTTNGSVRI